jgi:hypothetical protein
VPQFLQYELKLDLKMEVVKYVFRKLYT